MKKLQDRFPDVQFYNPALTEVQENVSMRLALSNIAPLASESLSSNTNGTSVYSARLARTGINLSAEIKL